jgi:hypothetical protein
MTNDALKRVFTDYERLLENPNNCSEVNPLVLRHAHWINERNIVAAILILASRVDELIEYFVGGEDAKN